nr:MAG TPA: hypothetical protein [Caudoviricetes sp.]
MKISNEHYSCVSPRKTQKTLLNTTFKSVFYYL